MDTNTYSKLALRTAADLGEQGDLTHAILGITSEAGEIADAYKKHFAYGKDLNRDAILEEVSDLAWFMNLLIHRLGSTWEDVLASNVAKLEKRYPDLRFNSEHATNRDTKAEQKAFAEHIGGQ